MRITTPVTEDVIKSIRVGDEVLLNGVIYTGRDAAHKKMTELIEKGLPLPFDPIGQAIYYAGPCPAQPGRVIGSIGPTTSSRMDAYAPRLIETGLKVMIGKGTRSDTVIKAIKKHTGLYLAAVGGAGALLSQCVISAEAVAFAELGAEAVYRLVMRDMPLIAAIDCMGNNIYGLR